MNSPSKLRAATAWLQDNLTFDLDQRVHVFEVTIRVLGTFSTGYAGHTAVIAETYVFTQSSTIATWSG